MPLETTTRALLEQLEAQGGPPLSELTPDQAREVFRAVQPPAPDIPVGAVRDASIPGPGGDIPVRLYRPDGEGPLPLLVHYHGGGWVIGDLGTHEADCRELCRLAGCAVLSVDYRLAPEHPYPAAAEDAYAALEWAAAHAAELEADRDRIAVGGDSAGGNLAAVAALMARDRGGARPCFQLLVYPVTDAAQDTASYAENGDGYLLTRDSMAWFWQHYCPDPGLRREPYASPLRAEDFSGLPALVMTAEFDPLRDEGEAYAARLQAAGVPAEVERYPGMIHGFFSLARQIPAARPALERAAHALRSALRASA